MSLRLREELSCDFGSGRDCASMGTSQGLRHSEREEMQVKWNNVERTGVENSVTPHFGEIGEIGEMGNQG
jgi:hypothetical protein